MKPTTVIRQALKVAIILLDLVVTVVSAGWLIEMEFSSSIAPDVVTPVLVVPLAAAVMLSWIVMTVVAYLSSNPPRLSWIGLLILLALALPAGVIALEQRLRTYAEENAYAPAVGLVTTNLAGLAYLTCALLTRRPT